MTGPRMERPISVVADRKVGLDPPYLSFCSGLQRDAARIEQGPAVGRIREQVRVDQYFGHALPDETRIGRPIRGPVLR